MEKKFGFTFILLALATVVQCAVALSADNSDIRGTVRDSQTGDPLPSASVLLVGTSYGAATDVEGKYIVRNVPPGSYTLRVSYIGYKTIETPIEVKEGEECLLQILQPNLG